MPSTSTPRDDAARRSALERSLEQACGRHVAAIVLTLVLGVLLTGCGGGAGRGGNSNAASHPAAQRIVLSKPEAAAFAGAKCVYIDMSKGMGAAPATDNCTQDELTVLGSTSPHLMQATNASLNEAQCISFKGLLGCQVSRRQFARGHTPWQSMLGSGSSSAAATSTSPPPGGNTTSPASQNGSSLDGYVRSVLGILRGSAAIRKQLVAAVAEANTNRATAEGALAAVVNSRKGEIQTAQALSVASGASTVEAALTHALDVSLVSDRLYQQWIRTGSAQVLKQAQANDTLAVAAKKQFLSLYNQLRAEVGLAPLPSTYYF
jgi:hypothetical protein